MASDLNDDLVLEIVSWLSARQVAQSKCLNKYMYHCINDPTFFTQKRIIQFNQINNHVVKTFFHCYDVSADQIFSKVYLNTLISDIPDRVNGRNLRSNIMVSASCKGLLLLQVWNTNFYYVFNPLTGGAAYTLVQKCGNLGWWQREAPGLAVDDVEGNYSCHSFKLVEVFHRRIDDNDVVQFCVIVPSEIGCSMYLKSSSDFVCKGFGGFADHYVTAQPVYLDGYLHWLGDNCNTILVFNVEKEKVSRIINGPVAVNLNVDSGFRVRLEHMWFGVAQGSLSFVYILHKEIVILGYDYVNDNWQIQHKLHVQSCLENNINLFQYVFPVFYDGQHLFFQPPIGDKHKGIYMIDLASKNERTHIGMLPIGWQTNTQIFFPFSPTLAKVSNEFLQTGFHSEIGAFRLVIEDLLELQNLLLLRR